MSIRRETIRTSRRVTPYPIPSNKTNKTNKTDVDIVLQRLVSPTNSKTMEEQYDTWRTIRDVSSITPREFHAPNSSFTQKVNELLETFRSNISIVKALMLEFNTKFPDNDNHVVLGERIAELEALETEFNNDIISKKTDEEDGESLVNKWFHITLHFLRDNQPIINDIQLLLPRNKRQCKIQFVEKINTTMKTTLPGNNTIVLFFLTHGTFEDKYPSLLAVPPEKNVCKTTLAIPNCPAFNSPEDLNKIFSDYKTIYSDGDIQDDLQENFVSSFTRVNDYLKNPMLEYITSRLKPTESISSNLAEKYKAWSDSLRNSTSSLMLQTRHNEYIRNKTYGIKKDDSNKNINNIYVLLDTTDRFNQGEQIIDYNSTFQEPCKTKNGSITLQELLNILYSNGWDNVGIIDYTCETGNQLTTLLESSNRLPYIRGGYRIRTKRIRYKKRKTMRRKNKTYRF